MLSDWDREIVEDMRGYIATIERAIEAADDLERIRPTVGDAPTKPLAYWQGEIAKNRKWIAEILATYN